jgi:Flp pilus assembly pilin Flp
MSNIPLKAATNAKLCMGAWANMTVAAMKRRSDRGQGAVEYVGVIVLVALIIVAIVGTDIDTTIADALSTAVDNILNSGG